MSKTKSKARRRAAPRSAPWPSSDPRVVSLAGRQAVTALVLEPTLAALREYRAQVTEELDLTIERLEAAERWTRTPGAQPPDLLAKLHAARTQSPAEPATFRKIIPSTIVPFCRQSLHAIADLACHGPGEDIGHLGQRLFDALVESLPDGCATECPCDGYMLALEARGMVITTLSPEQRRAAGIAS